MKNKIKKIGKIIGITIISIVLLYILGFIYSVIFEQEKIKNDIYHMEQLNIIKETFNKPMNGTHWFSDVIEFNDAYKVNIQPLENCYYFKRNNLWNYNYDFWFRYESLKNKLLHFSRYYVSPWKKFESTRLCWGMMRWGNMGGCYYQSDKEDFLDTISNPCED